MTTKEKAFELANEVSDMQTNNELMAALLDAIYQAHTTGSDMVPYMCTWERMKGKRNIGGQA